MIWVLLPILFVSINLAFYWCGLRDGLNRKVDQEIAKRRSKARECLDRLDDEGGFPPLVRSAVIKPTSRRLSQVEVDEDLR